MVLVRNKGQVKKIKERPDELWTTTTERGKEDVSKGIDKTYKEDDFEINLPTSPEERRDMEEETREENSRQEREI